MTGEQHVRTIRGFATRLKKAVRIAWAPPAHRPRRGPSDRGPGLYSAAQFRAAVERERARADRNGHHVSLALIQANGHRNGQHGSSRLLDILESRLRITDEAGWFDQARLGVLMPYTPCNGAWQMIDDLCRLMEGELALSDCRVYTYPYDWPVMNTREDRASKPGSAGAGGGAKPRADSRLALLDHRTSRGPFGMCARSACDGPVAAPACVYPLEPWPAVRPSVCQRGLDIVCSILGLLVLAPLLLVTALLIKLASPGPVFFKQVRLGQGGRPFVLWKFRTMVANADSSVHQNHVAGLMRSRTDDGERPGPMTKLDDDPRVIPLGRFLRRTCIDELPQLLNVLRGEMSLVGPRPPIPYEIEEYLPWQKRRLDALPGLTGLWQVSGKNRLTFDEMVRLDIRYGRTKSLWMNLRIMLRTPRAIAQEIVDTRVHSRTRVLENA